MRKRSGKRSKVALVPKRRQRDVNQIASATLRRTLELVDPEAPARDPAAVALGRRGGLKGGRARAEKLSPEERRASALKAARARWAKKGEGP